ncbi:hypothetical protein BJF85_13565 [Saccharomonospora sp. CUA-673]|uniref:sensor histidine kinase n=1 Tax=Saccharomonospora sp. CUA-673 TaxID=1904969 RepID=UPI000967769A|nr:histidine kinase [Saccharomonospora sp. CUA-673]OLT48244.1 hypothetical protein BJF85_13565 [Saccharomonospora sp. CUA-673]
MRTERLEQWAGLAGLAVYLVIGVPTVYLEIVVGDVTRGPFWVWLLCYVGYAAAMLAAWTSGAGSRINPGVHVTVMMGCGAATVLLTGNHGVTPILLVFVAAVAAQTMSVRFAVGVAIGNTAVVAVSVLSHGLGWMELLLSTALYAVLQAMYLFTAWNDQRERIANENLAVAHAELRSASALLAESSQAQERLRIARELHDQVGHKLSALALNLETASHRVRGQGAADDVERSRLLAKDLLADVRAAVGNLRSRPPELRTALDMIVRDLPRPRGHLTVADDVEVDERRITVLIRCVQEIVTNAIRHSAAANLWIEVRAADDGGIVLDARDDGRGTAALRLGNGLTGLRERAEEQGGTVSFDGRDGFAVHLELPPAEQSTVQAPVQVGAG